MSVDAAELRQLYRRWLLELWNGDLLVAGELVTDDFVVHQARADRAESESSRGTGSWRRPGSTWPSGAASSGCPPTCNTEADLDRALEVLDRHGAPVGSG